MKKLIIGLIVALVAVCVLGWPYGNVGLNVAEPEAQLDVGGDAIVRSNLTVRGGTLLVGEPGSGGNEMVRMGLFSLPDGEYKYLALIDDNTLEYDGKTILDGDGRLRFSENEGIWVHMGSGIAFRNYDNTRTGNVKFVTSPVTGVVFTVNGVSWTNLYTP